MYTIISAWNESREERSSVSLFWMLTTLSKWISWIRVAIVFKGIHYTISANRPDIICNNSSIMRKEVL